MLNGMAAATLAAEVDILDAWVALLGNLLLHPPGLITTAGLTVIRTRESSSVGKTLDVISENLSAA